MNIDKALRPGVGATATVLGRERTGVVHYISPHGWCVLVDANGLQWVGYPGRTTITEPDPKAAARGLTATQRTMLERLGYTPPPPPKEPT